MVKMFGFLTDPSQVFNLLAKGALGYVSYLALSEVYTILKLYFVSPFFGLALDVTKFGKWAVITGATDGIGKEFALQLADKGLKIVLISRNMDRLNATAEEIKKRKMGTEVKCIEADFSNTSIYPQIQKGLEGLDIGVLVNNVGQSYAFPKYYHELSEKFCDNLIAINVTSVTKMTHIVLKGMLERKRGLVLNISTFAANYFFPLFSLYGASKAFGSMLTQTLQYEYKNKGIVFQNFHPAMVTTKLSMKKKASFYVVTPKHFVSSALNTLGLKSDSTGMFSHELKGLKIRLIGLEANAKKLTGKCLAIRENMEKKNRDKKD